MEIATKYPPDLAYTPLGGQPSLGIHTPLLTTLKYTNNKIAKHQVGYPSDICLALESYTKGGYNSLPFLCKTLVFVLLLCPLPPSQLFISLT